MLQKSSISKTLEIFFINPTKQHYLMDISRKIKIAHTSVKKNLTNLEKQGLIIESIEKKGKRKFPFYKANINNKEFKKQKKVYNLSALLHSNLIEHLQDKLAPKSIVLFGSYSRGEDTEDSDIDLFIECKQESLDLKEFEKILNRNVSIIFRENFNKLSKELKNNIINGITLNGFLEGYK